MISNYQAWINFFPELVILARCIKMVIFSGSSNFINSVCWLPNSQNSFSIGYLFITVQWFEKKSKSFELIYLYGVEKESFFFVSFISPGHFGWCSMVLDYLMNFLAATFAENSLL
jgi:hypothetical protein